MSTGDGYGVIGTGLIACSTMRGPTAIRARKPITGAHEDLRKIVTESGTSEPICKSYLADQNLVNVDRASMACGLEVRAPFMDHNLLELACRIP